MENNKEYAVQMKDITIRFGSYCALNNVRLDVEKGSVHTVRLRDRIGNAGGDRGGFHHTGCDGTVHTDCGGGAGFYRSGGGDLWQVETDGCVLCLPDLRPGAGADRRAGRRFHSDPVFSAGNAALYPDDRDPDRVRGQVDGAEGGRHRL